MSTTERPGRAGSAGPAAEPSPDLVAAAGRLGDSLQAAAAQAVPEPQRQSRRLAAAIRRLAARMMTASVADLAAAADRVEGILAEMEAGPPARRYGLPLGESGPVQNGFFEWSPQFGRSNPIAPPLALGVDVEAATIVAEGVFGGAYEGPPGCVHGGALAAAFDEVLGMVQVLHTEVAMTGTLTVRYRRPTPLHRPLRFEAWLVARHGRKIVVGGRCLDGEAVTAEAEGLFVTVGADRFAELDAARTAPPAD